jgi:toxin ParE1/3/4
MNRRVHKKPGVERDLIQHFIYIGHYNESAALRFLKEAELAFAQIADTPGIGAVLDSLDPRLQNIRYTTISRRFRNYLIFYRIEENFIEILAIIHGTRDLPNLLSELL